MVYFLYFVGIAAWFAAFMTFFTAGTSIGQILGAIFGVSGCVLIAGGAIVDAVHSLKPKVPGEEKPPMEM